ncbi:nitrite reductase small subunit NirD [Gilvimarinus sp. 1_MG-2023]|uniref:nitrite reductase small subunit NirD n=1 Tax=Gilvimarinus sp. 1_MG-2023 TaxID=3062638 RepID=UPI0026E169F7|nr:nitrite reductase small subunit NirD [Gilvimarinus sp. 1_MG-2023]MDO6747997.1 nitrite reductase small subunit NirD [Gilvimarinus sp. 1_MG-2023]
MTNQTINTSEAGQWVDVCDINDLTPETGVCALVGEQQVAIFYSGKLDQLFAIDNYDPIGKANVLSRGIIGSIGERICVASPLYKQHFDLTTGECLEQAEHRIRAYPVNLAGNRVQVGIR